MTEVRILYGLDTWIKAEGLNAHRRGIVGVGTAPDGREHAF
jgi:hypothetical protein